MGADCKSFFPLTILTTIQWTYAYIATNSPDALESVGAAAADTSRVEQDDGPETQEESGEEQQPLMTGWLEAQGALLVDAVDSAGEHPEGYVAATQEDEEDAGAQVFPNQAPWEIGGHYLQPLQFEVPTDAAGGTATRQYGRLVDFNDAVQVRAANRYRTQMVRRAKERHGIMDRMRASTVGRVFTEAQLIAITTMHEHYSEENQGARIPPSELAVLFNQEFPGEDRTALSLQSVIGRDKDLKENRGSYDRK